MQQFVTWWCHLIGVTDAQAIVVATGIVAGGLLLMIVYVAVGAILALMTTR